MNKSIVIAFTAFFIMSIMAKDVTALSWNVWYLINKEYVAKELCVNKARPKLKCNGKCHLAKQLQKLENEPVKSQKSPASTTLKLKETTWISSNQLIQITTEYQLFSANRTENGWPTIIGAPHSFSTPIFHPPIG